MVSILAKKIKAALPEEYSGLGKIVLAYSGGLDTSVLLKLLQETTGAGVVTVTVDLGQTEYADQWLDKSREKALALGAEKAFVVDAKREFADGFVSRAIQANCMYQGEYPCSTALARPLIVKKLVEVAGTEGAEAIAHGCTGKGNDQVRFELAANALAPGMKVLAPVRDFCLSRDEEVEYAKQEDIPVPAKSKYSVDANLWGRSSECGVIESPHEKVPEDALEMVVPPEKARDAPCYAKIFFENGLPVKAECDGNGAEGLLGVVEFLNTLAGANGVGLIDHVEDRVVGLKSREFYECPAAVVLLKAHRDLEKFVFTREENEFKPGVDKLFAECVYQGKWFSPLVSSLNAFVEKSQDHVCGWVEVKLYKGSCMVVARSSPFALYDLNLATYDKSSSFNQSHAEGFIKLFGLGHALASKVRMNGVKAH